MKIVFISIFPEIFESFVSTSLIKRAVEWELLLIRVIDPRQYCDDKHQQIDDNPYGWWAWLVIKAPPVIAAIKDATHWLTDRVWVVLVTPSPDIFVQKTAHSLADTYDTLVFVCWRYEGIDHRVSLWWREQFGVHRHELSIGEFVTLWWELPAMTMSEAVVRLIPWVIKEQESWEKESYRPEQGWKKIEHPHYTRPAVVEWYDVPEVLLSWNHAVIEQRRDDLTK